MAVASPKTFNAELLKKEFLKAKETHFSSTLNNKAAKPFNQAIKMDEKTKLEYFKIGIDAITSGQVAIITMAGGQGTRLGTSSPKGFYKINGKSLFHHQKERLENLSKYINTTSIMWFVMTSEATHKETVDYFQREIGYPKERMHFFQQGSFPALDKDGNMIKIDANGNLFMAPNGNGNLFESFKNAGYLEMAKKNGVKYFHIIPIDNVLVKPADPFMVGAAIKNSSDAVLKSVDKRHPQEKIGVFALNEDGKLMITEYSELKGDNVESYREANMASHLFSLEFMQLASSYQLSYHLAEKKIPLVDGSSTTGYKMEKFIFDILPMATKPIVLNVDRCNEFSPLKNATGDDSPQSCSEDLKSLSINDDYERIIFKS